jgi:hypothetical protein
MHHDAATEASVRAQIDGMHRADRAWALAFVVALLIMIPFMLIALWGSMPTTGTKVALLASGAVLTLYNVASMLKLVQNYTRDKDFIYRRDVAHLRELKVAREARKAAR